MAKRAALKDLTVSLGLLRVTGDVLTAVKVGAKNAEDFKYACPRHPKTPHGVKQRYVCEENLTGATYETSELLKMKVTDDGNILVDKSAIAEAKTTDLPERTLDLRAHPYEPESTFAAGSAHIFLPATEQGFYSVLLQILDESGVIQTEEGPRMLVGMVSFRKGSESFVRLERWGNQLVLRELVRPEDIDSFPEIGGTVDPKDVAMAKMLVAAETAPFEAEAYKKSVRDRLEALVKEAGGDVPAPFKRTTKAKAADLSSLLQASIDAARAAKA